MVLGKKKDAHETALRQWLQRTTQIFPNQHYRYFNARFAGPDKRALAFTDLDNLADYEEFLCCLRKDEQWRTYVNQWKTCIDASSMQPLYWEERDGQLEE
jgi:hypothetical protein